MAGNSAALRAVEEVVDEIARVGVTLPSTGEVTAQGQVNRDGQRGCPTTWRGRSRVLIAPSADLHLKSLAVNGAAAGCTSTSQFPELSRHSASVP
jgi:hypothetical protein